VDLGETKQREIHSMQWSEHQALTTNGHLSVNEAIMKAGVLRQLRCPCRTPVGAALHHDRIVRPRLREPVLLLPLLL